MHQITQKTNDSSVVGVQYLNNIVYYRSELILFADVVCTKIGLSSLKKYIEDNDYNHYLLQEHIRKIAKGVDGGFWPKITESSKMYHEGLFDVMYIKKLDELPLMINGVSDLVPVVSWRFEIAK
jgi:hypothetical protein